jgi:hypothetical protein
LILDRRIKEKTMNDKSKILAKIKKCLALASSMNEHEAAAALRQAQKLMAEHGISDLDIQAAEAEERRTKAGAARRPAMWETILARKIADAFACRVILCSTWRGGGEWTFIGCGASPEIASYAFAVTARQSKRARGEYIKSHLMRCKTATKTRRADLFSEGWVRGVANKIAAFAGNEKQVAAIDAYIAKHHPDLTTGKSTDRNADKMLSEREYSDHIAGALAGAKAEINRGVGGTENLKALNHDQAS